MHDTLIWGHPSRGEPRGQGGHDSSVSVDGFVADENDQPGPLFDWLTSGDVALDESGVLKVSQKSYDYTRPYWDQIGDHRRPPRLRHHGRLGREASGRDRPRGRRHPPAAARGLGPEAPFHFVDGVEAVRSVVAPRNTESRLTMFGRTAAQPNERTRPSGSASAGRPGLLITRRTVQSVGVLDELQLEVDLDLVGDDGVAGTERGLEADAVGLAADRGLGGEARARPAVGVDGLAEELDGQLDRLGGAADGQVADEDELVAVDVS